MINKKSTNKNSKNIRKSADTRAYMIGGGIASLSAAAFLILDAKVPGKNITIFEALNILGGSLDGAGDAKRGFIIRGGRMLNIPTYECLQALQARIPSIEIPGVSMQQEFLEFNEEFKTMARARLVNKDGGKVDVSRMLFSAADRLQMEKLILLETEKSLGKKTIQQFFGKHFFKTNFWFMWQTTFAFQPWSSAAELRRYMLRFMHEFPRIHNLSGVARTAYNQYESIAKPIIEWLKERGVKFEMSAVADDMKFADKLVSEIIVKQRGRVKKIPVRPNDMVYFTNGCITDKSTEGATDKVAKYDKSAPESFSLWKKIANGRPELGRPDVFSAKPDQSVWMSFTPTINDNPLMMDYIEKWTRNHPGGGALVTFKDSKWLLSFVVARQPHFKNQPQNSQIFWGYSLNMFTPGDYVKKPMIKCTGREIMKELMGHLHIPAKDQAKMMKGVIVRTAIMPYIDALFQPREIGDRPLVRPAGYDNLAFISQFAEQPDDVVFTVEYSVRAAQRAVYDFMGIDAEIPPVSKHQYEPKVLLKSFLKMHS